MGINAGLKRAKVTFKVANSNSFCFISITKGEVAGIA
jgi:hypothetical protein